MAKKIGCEDTCKPRYPDDCKRLVELARFNGYIISLREAEDIWHEHSRLNCCGWLHLYLNDDTLWFAIKPGILTRLD